jgi:hypothetical protein
MTILNPALDEFRAAYKEMLGTHKEYLEAHVHTIKGGVYIKNLSEKTRQKINTENVPLYTDDMTVGMMYGHYWGNAAFHHIDHMIKYDILDIMFTTEYHDMDGMKDTGRLHTNPYRRYDGLYACVETIKNKASRVEKDNFSKHQQNIVNMVRADRNFYMQTATEMNVLKGNEKAFDRFWQTSHYNPKNADMLQNIIR